MRATDIGDIDAALRSMPYGVYIVTTRGPQGDHGLTASWVMQVAKDPPTVAVALHRGSASAKAVSSSRVFAVNVLSVESRELAERFITPVDRFDAPPQPTVVRGVLRLPLLGEAIGWLECEVKQEIELGDHVLVLGEVVPGELKKADLPLTTIAAGMGYGGVAR